MNKLYSFILFLVFAFVGGNYSVAQTNFQLQILHASDLEGGVDAIDAAPRFAAIADTLEKQYSNTLIISSGDNYIPGPFFNAAAERSLRDTIQAIYQDFYNNPALTDLREANGRFDISIMNFIGFDATAFGNHDFDAGTSVIEDIIGTDVRSGGTQARWLGADFPYLSANLDFSNSNLAGLSTTNILPADSFRVDYANFLLSANRPKIAPATTFQMGTHTVGLVGATTQLLASISSPGSVNILSGGSNDMVALAGILQPVIDSLTANGADIILIASHLQQFALEQQLAGLLNDVDVILAGGSDNILADGNDVLHPGDVATGTYPFLTTNAQGDTVAIVSTDGEYSYVGRLVVEFDVNGKLIPSSIDSSISGVYATMPSVLHTLWDSVAGIAPGTKGGYVARLTNAVRDIVTQKDGNILGNTSVFLDGRRSTVRQQESNVGNLTADANLWLAQQVDPSVTVSIKNGGGIRAAIGEVVETSPGVYQFLPPQANPISGKQTGEISQLDIENTLRFNNGLVTFETTKEGLLALLEHGVSAWTPTATPGQFPQIGGIQIDFDPNKPPYSRISSIVTIDSAGNQTGTLVRNGRIWGDPNQLIKVVSLDFLVNNDGDSYPFSTWASNVQALNTAAPQLADTTFSNGGEQDALAEYLLAFHNGPANAFGNAETPIANDQRIRILSQNANPIFANNYTLQLLHASDLEGGVAAIDRAPNFAALTETFENETGQALIISSGDNYIPGPFFNAAAERSLRDTIQAVYQEFYNNPTLTDLREANGRIDISIMNFIGFDASTFGNHDFDAGTSAIEDIIGTDVRSGGTQARWLGADFPYLSANLDFSNSNLAGLATTSILPRDSFRVDYNNFQLSANRPKIAPATVIERNGEMIGIVGATTQLLASISSPGQVNVITGGSNDMVALAGVLQPYIDSLTAMGINKIIVSTHLQQFALEQQLIGLLNDVDIVIAGGSDFLLADNNDVLRSGDVAQGNYPFMTANANGDTALIVSTAGEYSYLGRLIVEFDSAGVLVPNSLDEFKNGAWATLDSIVTQVGASTAPGTVGGYVARLTNAVRDIVTQKDGNILGNTSVFLDGRRSTVRQQESNVGNLTADANLWLAQQVDPSVTVSIKNGGGIRAAIGEVVETSPGVYQFLPPQANPISGKQTGEISQLDIENTLRFNNGLVTFETTAEGLVALVEHGISAWTATGTPGQFPQVGGIRFSFDPNLPANSRIQSMVIVDNSGNYIDTLVRSGNLFGNPNRAINVVSLDFLVNNDGDNYPFSTWASNVQALDATAPQLADTTFSNGGEQDALAEYLLAFHNNTANAFADAETDFANDTRIENLSFRSDDILTPPFSLVSPMDAAVLDLSGDNAENVIITWTALDDAAATYEWSLSAAGNVLLSIPTSNDTSLSLPFGAIDNLLRTNGVSIGNNISLTWNVEATTNGVSFTADNGPFDLTIERGIVTRDFDLVGPVDGAALTIEGDQTQTATINWESHKWERGNGDVIYTWLLDAAGGDFSNPITSVLANNNGNDTLLTLDFETINQLLVDNGVTSTLNAIWTVEANADGTTSRATATYAIDLSRGEMTSLSEIAERDMILFPNPTQGNIQLVNIPADYNTFQIIDASGKIVSAGSINSERLQLSIDTFQKGIYYLQLVGNNVKTLPVFLVE